MSMPLVASGTQMSDWITRFTMVLVLALMLVFVLMPVFWMIKSSFQSTAEINALPPHWIPENPTFDAYAIVGKLLDIWRYLANSLFVSIVAALIASLISCMAAYVLARLSFPGATFILLVILLTQLIPDITRVLPVYFLIQDLGLLNNYVGLMLAYVGFTVPYAVLLLHGYFKSSCPPELEEAAMMDGCTYFGAFVRVILPVSLPGIAAATIFTFLLIWNDFLWASLLVSSGEMKTVQIGIAELATEDGGQGRYQNAFMAACVISTVPALILFFFVQRWLVGGLTAGAVKS